MIYKQTEDLQTGRQAGYTNKPKIYKQTDRQAGRQTGYTNKQNIYKRMGRQADRQDIQTNRRSTNKQTGRQTVRIYKQAEDLQTGRQRAHRWTGYANRLADNTDGQQIKPANRRRTKRADTHLDLQFIGGHGPEEVGVVGVTLRQGGQGGGGADDGQGHAAHGVRCLLRCGAASWTHQACTSHAEYIGL